MYRRNATLIEDLPDWFVDERSDILFRRFDVDGEAFYVSPCTIDADFETAIRYFVRHRQDGEYLITPDWADKLYCQRFYEPTPETNGRPSLSVHQKRWWLIYARSEIAHLRKS